MVKAGVFTSFADKDVNPRPLSAQATRVGHDEQPRIRFMGMAELSAMNDKLWTTI